VQRRGGTSRADDVKDNLQIEGTQTTARTGGIARRQTRREGWTRTIRLLLLTWLTD